MNKTFCLLFVLTYKNRRKSGYKLKYILKHIKHTKRLHTCRLLTGSKFVLFYLNLHESKQEKASMLYVKFILATLFHFEATHDISTNGCDKMTSRFIGPFLGQHRNYLYF